MKEGDKNKAKEKEKEKGMRYLGPVGDVGTESNAAINHPQQEFASAAQLAVLQAQGSSLPPIGSSPPGAPLHTPKFPTIETPPTAALLQAPVSLAPPSAPHFYSLTSGPNPYWGQPSWMLTPTLVETPVLILEQRLEEMMGGKIDEVMSNKSSRQQSMVLEEDPFSLEVMVVPLPRDFKQSKMEKYDGSSDPVDHLRSFVDLMRLQATPDAIMCRAFSPTLRLEARNWVATLPSKSIRTFDEFFKSIATHFASSKRVKKTTISMIQLAQGKDELLKDFIARFNRVTLRIKDLQMSAVVTAMMSGTQSCHFLRCHYLKTHRILCMSYLGEGKSMRMLKKHISLPKV
ncbi:Retrotrans gag domain-containing protein [Abeliophyllum distichum]|uniref:Retrotrans gag domain-containing protein n=1 Tax=Abeliophyllum distichum TaxID=126358 RepID=A0ABD1R0D7_9LAMI